MFIDLLFVWLIDLLLSLAKCFDVSWVLSLVDSLILLPIWWLSISWFFIIILWIVTFSSLSSFTWLILLACFDAKDRFNSSFSNIELKSLEISYSLF